MTVKHTPGPWEVQDPMGADVGLWVVQFGLEARQWSCIAIVTDDEDGTARDEGGRFIGRTEQQANARLIAAAPDMLEALYEAEECFDNLSDADHDGTSFVPNKEMNLLSVVRAAIAKATGK